MADDRFRYSYNSLVYYEEDTATSVDRVARFGYDAIEIVGEPSRIDAKQVARLTKGAGIGVSSICSIYTADRDLVHPDPDSRRAAIRYVKDLVDFAATMECPTVVLHPTANGKTQPLADPAEEWKWAVESIRTVGEYAAGRGVSFSLEAWNRYETYFVNRLEQARRLWKETELTNGGVQGDTFHMNIEEVSIPDAFRASEGVLQHVHLADADRTAPGGAHIDFEPILEALLDIGYDKYVAFELLPAMADPFASGRHEEFFDRYTERAIRYLRAVEDQVRTRRELAGRA
ncbi:sugar phosphate isomerase/epimerase family protein [Georgenia sp. SYP-B2076]|uniref:sugar phosphate isomerase/epimerase family protein n=1 Tax=Georgenia sp. SYP-B2076 TaxID=2495881 RepID=UPI000F8D68C6|nr:sugar phosphate isomerase/epimerase family protein [Georgenia sp. SYP-B2076]